MADVIAPIEIEASPPASDVCRAAKGAGPWLTPPAPDENADAYFTRLIDDGRLEEATRFVAAWLGPRRAVWWASLCVWSEHRATPPVDGDPRTAAIDAAVAWVLDPTESLRRHAQAAAEAVGFATAAGALATAAFWSEGSISLPGQPEVPSPPGLAAKAAANAVLMTSAAPALEVRQTKLRQALRMAAELIAGANHWSRTSPSLS